MLLSTSGSTGSTKLVRLSEAAMLSNAAAIVDYLGIDAGERAITSLPISYSYGLSILTSHLLAGASIVLSDKTVTDEDFWDLFATQQVTSLAGVPYTYELLEAIRFRDRALPTMRYMTQAGGRLDPEIIRRYAQWCSSRGMRFYTMYGQTEAAPRMAYLAPELALCHADCIGRAIPGGQLRVVDASGRTVTMNTTGELVYAGANVMMGYAHGPEDLARGPELAELYTGDLAQEVEDGLFKIVGRSSRFSKISGLRVGLDDMERILRERGHAATVAGNDDLIAVAIVGDDGSISVVSAIIGEILPISIESRVVFTLPEIPRLMSGKIDYQNVLAAGIKSRATEAALSAVGFSDRGSVASEFSRVLHLGRVEGNESFSSLGGDSLSYVQLSIAIEGRIGHLPVGWERLTVDQIDTLILQRPHNTTGPSVRISTEIALRAMAITVVVAHHTLMMDLGGGLAALMVLLGLNIARSQPGRDMSPSRWKVLSGIAMRLLLPYYVVLLVYASTFHDHLPWKVWLLLGNCVPLHGSPLSIYWFVPAYVQVLLIVFLLNSIPPLRRFMRDDSGMFGVLFLAGALLLKVGAFAIFHHSALHGRTPDQFIYIVALGWCLHAAKTTTARMALIVVTACIAVLDWTGAVSNVWSTFDGRWWNESLLATVIVLAFVRSMRLPHVVGKVLTSIAVASLMIYLTHPLLLSLTADWFAPPQKFNPFCYLAIGCYLAFGVMTYRAAGFFRQGLMRLEKRYRSYLESRKTCSTGKIWLDGRGVDSSR